MGALHDGHLSLVKQSVAENHITCASIFINPLQFNDSEDFKKYPDDKESDIGSFENSGCDMVFTGSLLQFFPGMNVAEEIVLKDPGSTGLGLEGDFRPGHLQGVVTIVEQLFKTVGSCNAYFGEKDFQQTLVVTDLAKKMQKDGIDVNVIACPTIRETSGLAMSSRNQRLTAEQKNSVTIVYKTLQLAKQSWNSGIQDSAEIETIMFKNMKSSKISVDYCAVRDEKNWTVESPVGVIDSPRALIAAYVGDVRLIDNMSLY